MSKGPQPERCGPFLISGRHVEKENWQVSITQKWKNAKYSSCQDLILASPGID
jgi:hypothetical protein